MRISILVRQIPIVPLALCHCKLFLKYFQLFLKAPIYHWCAVARVVTSQIQLLLMRSQDCFFSYRNEPVSIRALFLTLILPVQANSKFF